PHAAGIDVTQPGAVEDEAVHVARHEVGHRLLEAAGGDVLDPAAQADARQVPACALQQLDPSRGAVTAVAELQIDRQGDAGTAQVHEGHGRPILPRALPP